MAMDYTVTLTGTPKQTGSTAQAFKMAYPVHVAAPAAKKSSTSPLLWVAITIGIVAIIMAAIAMERSGKRQTTKPE